MTQSQSELSEFKKRLEATLRRGNSLNPELGGQPQLPPMSSGQMSQHPTNPFVSSGATDNNYNAVTSEHEPSSSQGQVQKRALTLQTTSPLASSNFTNSQMTDDAPTCKSPKILSPGFSRIWTPPMCSICMDDLFCCPDPTPGDATQSSWLMTFENKNTEGNSLPCQASDLRPTVSTRCGHLFHTECVNKWFLENKEKEIKECPYCKREMMANDTTRIFPVFGND